MRRRPEGSNPNWPQALHELNPNICDAFSARLPARAPVAASVVVVFLPSHFVRADVRTLAARWQRRQQRLASAKGTATSSHSSPARSRCGCSCEAGVPSPVASTSACRFGTEAGSWACSLSRTRSCQGTSPHRRRSRWCRCDCDCPPARFASLPLSHRSIGPCALQRDSSGNELCGCRKEGWTPSSTVYDCRGCGGNGCCHHQKIKRFCKECGNGYVRANCSGCNRQRPRCVCADRFCAGCNRHKDTCKCIR
jgi:hypothetical protein